MDQLRAALNIDNTTGKADWKRIFALFDCKDDTDKSITKEEFCHAIENTPKLKAAVPNKQLEEEIFNQIDEQFYKDGSIKMSELQEALRPTLDEKRKNYLKQYFTALTKGDMDITVQDMTEILGGSKLMTNDVISKIVRRFEKAGHDNTDNKIDLQEFYAASVEESQETIGDDKKFENRMEAIWGLDKDYNWDTGVMTDKQ